MNVFQKTENLNLALGAALNIGCKIVNIGAQDIISGKKSLILGVVWQLIKCQLLSKLNFKNNPAMIALLEPGEDPSLLSRLSAEEILMRWVNYHLKRAGFSRPLTNFGGDLNVSHACMHHRPYLTVPSHYLTACSIIK